MMPESIDARIARQLDLLDDPNLTEAEIARIKEKVAVLEAQKEKAS